MVSSLVLLRSPEALARQVFPNGDYKIYLRSELTEQEVMAAGNPVSDPKKADHVESELKNIVASHSNIALDEINTANASAD